MEEGGTVCRGNQTRASVHPFQENRWTEGCEIKTLKRHLPMLVELHCSIDAHQHSYARSVSVSANETLIRISGENWWTC